MHGKQFAAILLGALLVVVGVAVGVKTCAMQERHKRARRKPTPKEALGSTALLPDKLRRAFAITPQQKRLGVPNRGDWLAEHHEPGQTFDAFVAAKYNRPDAKRRTLVLQPVGTFPPERSPPIEALKQYAEAFFQLPVEVRRPVDPKLRKFTTRINAGSGKRQILVGDIMQMLRARLQHRTYAALGITMIDLYPSPDWNFVFGQASYRGRVGAFSFARYDAAFYGYKRGPGWKRLLLKRSLRVLNHETGHMFGIWHCIFYQCTMNGSNHLAEDDRTPLHLCPVCLRKLHRAIGFDIEARYEALRQFFRRHGLRQDARWIARRLAWIRRRK